jgi:hypothetical protein
MKPSELIKMALEDLEKCEQDPKYKIYMSTWCEMHRDQCHVCFAGAIMAQRFRYENADLDNFDVVWRNRFKALDRFRRGEVSEALAILGINVPCDYRQVTHYNYDRDLFKQEMHQIGKDLEEQGL